ncbi:MAG: DUF4124 domain-containing protein [Oceanospirillaceae bacterium]|nr:DUF4124 domain-containing protein [Oceanospirillaceae bacterium]
MKGLIFVSLMFVSSLTNAGLYKCLDDNGSINFSDVPCAHDTTQTVLERDVDDRGFRTALFKNPGSSGSAICNDQYCTCSDMRVSLNEDPVTQLSTSIYSLTASWENLENAKSHGSRGQSYFCRIKIHQYLINRLYPKVLKQKSDLYRTDTFMGKQKIKECGEEPEKNSKEGWISDRTYIKWYECTEALNENKVSKFNNKEKKKFKKLDRALDLLR